VDKATYRLKNGLIGLVINPISEWVVNSIIFAFASPNILIKKDIKVKLKNKARRSSRMGAGRLRKKTSWAHKVSKDRAGILWLGSFPLLASPAHISGHITATHKPVESCLWIQT
jgi:hypothetical protein